MNDCRFCLFQSQWWIDLRFWRLDWITHSTVLKVHFLGTEMHQQLGMQAISKKSSHMISVFLLTTMMLLVLKFLKYQ